jgi:hypothetical protein
MTGLLPLHVAPQNGEALASWIARLSVDLRLSPLALGRMAFGIDAAVDPEWWRRPSAETLALIAKRTGVSTSELAAMTFTGWASAWDDETPQRLGGKLCSASPPRCSAGDRRVNICPLCLAEDRRGYLRLLWMNGWTGVCPEHRVILTGRCPSCRCVVRVAGLNAKLGGAAGDPAYPSTLRLQEVLIAGKQSGRTKLPSAGTLDWPTTMALIDILLGMVSIDIPQKYRDRLFARIANDLDLGEHNNIVWSSNYGGLLIVAWLLDDLATRLSAAIAILHAPRLDRLLARIPALSREMNTRLRGILAPAILLQRDAGAGATGSSIFPKLELICVSEHSVNATNCGVSVCSHSRPFATEYRSSLPPRALVSLPERCIGGCTKGQHTAWKPPWSVLDANRN